MFGWLLVGVVAASTSVAGAAPLPVPVGELILNLGQSNQWEFGSETQPLETLQGNNCELAPLLDPEFTPAQPRLVLLTSDPGDPAPAFLDKRGKEWIGIKGPGIDCGRVNPNEWLQINLSGLLAGNFWTRADLWFNVKGNAKLAAQAYRDDVAVGDPLLLFTGNNSSEADIGAGDSICAEGSDSDPDNDAANCNWEIFAPGEANALRLTTVEGEFGLGGEGSLSTIEIAIEATGELDCGGIATEVVEFPGGEGTGVQCRRLDNVVDDDSCEVVSYSLTTHCEVVDGSEECQSVFIHAPEAGDPLNTTKFAFVCETWWPTTAATFDEEGVTIPIAKTQQFFGSDTVGTDLDFCEGVTPVFFPGNPDCTFGDMADGAIDGGTVLGCSKDDIERVLVPPEAELDHSGLAGQQVGCLLDERVFQVQDPLVVDPDDPPSTIETLLKIFQKWYVQGDYTFSKRL